MGIVAQRTLLKQKTVFGERDQVTITLIFDEKDKAGNPKELTPRLTRSLEPGSSLRKLWEAAKGAPPPSRADLEELVGCELDVVIDHRLDSKGRMWANVVEYQSSSVAPAAPAPQPQRKDFHQLFPTSTQTQPKVVNFRTPAPRQEGQ